MSLIIADHRVKQINLLELILGFVNRIDKKRMISQSR